MERKEKCGMFTYSIAAIEHRVDRHDVEIDVIDDLRSIK